MSLPGGDGTSGGPPRGLTFCDVSMFFCPRGGGITTYHRAKLDWFARQSWHRYVLVVPGPRFRATAYGDAATVIETYGPTLGRGRDGYRLMLDYRGIRRTVAAMQPDLVEVGDPWISGPFALLMRRGGHFRGVLASFYHSDPISAYAMPWVRRTRLPQRVAGGLLRRSASLFWRAQALYDCTVVASDFMRRHVEAGGIPRVVLAPFGVDQQFLAQPPRVATSGRPVRLLYAGRLQPEKGIDQVLDLMPHIVDPPSVTLTIAGSGPYEERIAGLEHRGVTWVGHVGNRGRLHELYRSHDILLAPAPAETFGLTVLEAMANGLVVVGADSGGVGHLQHLAASPFGFTAGDLDSFVDACRRAIDADRSAVSCRSRAIAERHGTWRDAMGRQVAIYESMVDQRAGCP